jgi:hypothetical protein
MVKQEVPIGSISILSQPGLMACCRLAQLSLQSVALL